MRKSLLFSYLEGSDFFKDTETSDTSVHLVIIFNNQGFEKFKKKSNRNKNSFKEARVKLLPKLAKSPKKKIKIYNFDVFKKKSFKYCPSTST